MTPVFCMSNGRSGTKYLKRLLQANLDNAHCIHEPNLSLWNPSMFGPSISDRLNDPAALEKVFRRKRRWIESCRREFYVETSHAFLKSFAWCAVAAYPHLKLIHLVRNPIATARSEANRQLATDMVRLPARYVRNPDSSRFFRWALTGKEEIFKHFPPGELTLFQRYVVQWVEIENRAMAFLDEHGKHEDCATLHTPNDYYDADRLGALFEKLELKRKPGPVRAPRSFSPLKIRKRFLDQNQTPGFPTVVGDGERREFDHVIRRLPASYLEIFKRERYATMPWSGLLSPG